MKTFKTFSYVVSGGSVSNCKKYHLKRNQ